MSENCTNDTTGRADTIHHEVAQQWESAAAGWTRWEAHLAGSFWPVTQRLLSAAEVGAGMRVLDVGGGIGDPALAAAFAVGPAGSVHSVDLAAGMLATSRERARAYGLSQVTFEQAAVEDITAPAGGFDAIVARFSIMFFPSVERGLARLRELLRPGGRIAVAVWTPPNVNEGFALPSRVLREFVELPPSEPDAPGPFRLSGDGELADALAGAGFTDVAVEDVRTYLFAADPESYWAMLVEVSSIFRKHYAGLSSEVQDRVRLRLLAEVERFRSREVLRLPARARVGSGINPAEKVSG